MMNHIIVTGRSDSCEVVSTALVKDSVKLSVKYSSPVVDSCVYCQSLPHAAYKLVDSVPWSSRFSHVEISVAAAEVRPESTLVLLDESDISSWSEQASRLIDALRGDSSVTPTADEHWMAMARGAARRSASVSRRVGAVVVRQEAIIAAACNEVPRFGGGYSWSDDEIDLRDCASHDLEKHSRKQRVVLSFLNALYGKGLLLKSPDEVLQTLDETDMSGFMPYVDVGRAVHAELACLCDAARAGVSVQSAAVYSTELPCYQCCRALVAAGVSEVIFDHRTRDSDDALYSELMPVLPMKQFSGIRWENAGVH